MQELDAQIGSVGKLIKAVAGLLAFFPLLALMFEIVKIPESLANMAKIASFFVTVACIFGVILNRKLIERTSNGRASVIILATVLFGIAAAVSYWTIGRTQIIGIEQDGKIEQIVLPMNPSSDIRRMIAPFRDEYADAIIESAQSDKLRQKIDEENATTFALLFTLLVAANVLLVVGIVGGAWKIVAAFPVSASAERAN